MTEVVLAVKTCTKCDEVKPLTEFHVNRQNKDGRSNWCKPCASDNARKNLERRRAEMGEEAFKAQRAEEMRRWRAAADGSHRKRGRESSKAYYRALMKLKARHPDEFEAILRIERYEQNLL